MNTLARYLVKEYPSRLDHNGGEKMNLKYLEEPMTDSYFSKQLTLSELIALLNLVVDKRVPVKYDFGDFFPARINAWGGAFSELAIGYQTEGHPPSVAALLKLLKKAIGKPFSTSSKQTFIADGSMPVWVANRENIGKTAVMDVLDNELEVILITGFCEH